MPFSPEPRFKWLLQNPCQVIMWSLLGHNPSRGFLASEVIYSISKQQGMLQFSSLCWTEAGFPKTHTAFCPLSLHRSRQFLLLWVGSGLHEPGYNVPKHSLLQTIYHHLIPPLLIHVVSSSFSSQMANRATLSHSLEIWKESSHKQYYSPWFSHIKLRDHVTVEQTSPTPATPHHMHSSVDSFETSRSTLLFTN